MITNVNDVSVFELKRGMELVLLVGLLCTVVNGVDFDPEPDKWIQGQYGSFSCSNVVFVTVNKNGKEVTTCSTDGVNNVCSKPAPSYSKVTVTGNTLNFTILNVSRARDTANWECGGTTTYIDVKVPVPSATIENKNISTFTEGQTTSITCKTGVSYPPATITWSVGGTDKNGATTTNNPDGTTTSILQYTPDKTDHNKILQCSATNGFPEPTSTKSDSMTLNIRFTVSSVTIVNKSSLTFTDGQTTSITCKTGVSNPPVNITWSVGGTDKNGATTTNNPDGTTTSILQYTADKTDHNKTLQCSAFNGFGSTKSDSMTLNIRSAPESKSNLQIHECLSVEVTVISNPKPFCKWLINGEATKEMSTIHSDGNQHTCKLSSNSELRSLPSGGYYVNISNGHGSISANITVPETTDPFPDYLLAVQIIHIIAVFLVFLVISCSDKGEKFKNGVSIASVVLIVVCMGLLIYLLVKLQEEAWIITSSLVIVFTVLTAVIIILINRISILKEIKDEHLHVGLVVSCVITILFSLAALIYLVVTLSQYDVCKEEYLGAGVGFQAVDVLVIALLLVTVLKMKTGR